MLCFAVLCSAAPQDMLCFAAQFHKIRCALQRSIAKKATLRCKACFVALQRSGAKEGDDNNAAVAFFFFFFVQHKKSQRRRRRQRCYAAVAFFNLLF
jgi:hypothetical protein